MDKTPLTQRELWTALLPWIIVCIVMLIWGNGAFKTWANSIFTWNYPVPDLHNMINVVAPVAAKPTPQGAVFGFTYLSFTGTGMLIAAIIAGFLAGRIRVLPGEGGGLSGRGRGNLEIGDGINRAVHGLLRIDRPPDHETECGQAKDQV